MQTLMVKSGFQYRKATPAEIAAVAGAQALEALNRARPVLDTPTHTIGYLRKILSGRDYESFMVLFLDTRHKLIDGVELFRGTLGAAHVHVREVLKECLWRGAAAVVLAHNHPSGLAAPSDADERITSQLQRALALIDVRVVDHIIIGGPENWFSMAEHRLL
jgi:DNA repair protein RadC